MTGTPIPINYAGPLPNQQQIQNAQSAETQAGAVHTGADLLNSMTEARLDKLSKAQDIINQEIGKTMGAASTPVPVSGTGAINLPGQHNWAGIPTDYSPTYSHSGSVNQGIGNIIRGVANVAGSYLTKRQNDKNKALSVDIQRAMEAQQGYESAKQVADQDPNNKDAQKTMAKNKAILDALFNDPKRAKDISKAFDISFVDPSKNNTPQHGALKDAVKSYSDQFIEKMPTQMGPNQVAQARLGQLMELQKNISEQMRAVSSDRTTEYLLRSQDNADRIAQRDRELDFKKSQQQDRVQHWQQQATQRQQQFDTKLKSLSEIAKLTNDTRLQVADKQVAGRLAAINRAIGGRIQYANSTGGQLRALNTNMLLAQRALQLIPTAMLQAQDRYNFKGASEQDKKNMQEYINHLQDLKDMYTKMLTDDQNTFNNLMGTLGDDNNSGGNQDGSGSTDDGSDINIPEPIAPVRPSLQHSDDIRDLPKTIQQSQPVQPVGGSEDKDDDKYINIIRQGLAGG